MEVGFCNSNGSSGFSLVQPADQLERWSLPVDNGTHLVVPWTPDARLCNVNISSYVVDVQTTSVLNTLVHTFGAFPQDLCAPDDVPSETTTCSPYSRYCMAERLTTFEVPAALRKIVSLDVQVMVRGYGSISPIGHPESRETVVFWCHAYRRARAPTALTARRGWLRWMAQGDGAQEAAGQAAEQAAEKGMELGAEKAMELGAEKAMELGAEKAMELGAGGLTFDATGAVAGVATETMGGTRWLPGVASAWLSHLGDAYASVSDDSPPTAPAAPQAGVAPTIASRSALEDAYGGAVGWHDAIEPLLVLLSVLLYLAVLEVGRWSRRRRRDPDTTAERSRAEALAEAICMHLTFGILPLSYVLLARNAPLSEAALEETATLLSPLAKLCRHPLVPVTSAASTADPPSVLTALIVQAAALTLLGGGCVSAIEGRRGVREGESAEMRVGCSVPAASVASQLSWHCLALWRGMFWYGWTQPALSRAYGAISAVLATVVLASICEGGGAARATRLALLVGAPAQWCGGLLAISPLVIAAEAATVEARHGVYRSWSDVAVQATSAALATALVWRWVM